MATASTTKEVVSQRLRGLKFMQKAKVREEVLKKQAAEEVAVSAVDDSHWVSPAAFTTSRCRVIVESDPKPGALLGRMSFQNFNPSVEKIIEEVEARRERIRNVASTSNLKEDKPTVGIRTANENGVELGKVEVDEIDNMPMRKRQKVEKVTIVSTESTTIKGNSVTNVRAESDRHQQQRDIKPFNPNRDWRNLRPPGR